MTEQNLAEKNLSDESDEVIYLGFWARFIGFIVDSIAATLLITPLAAQFIDEIVLTEFDLSDQAELILMLKQMITRFSFDAILIGTLFIGFWMYRNATPGKMIFGAVIVDAKTLGKPTATQNILRYLSYYISLLPFALGFFWIGFDSRKQGWHDKIAWTVVIKGKPHTTTSE